MKKSIIVALILVLVLIILAAYAATANRPSAYDLGATEGSLEAEGEQSLP